MVKIQAVCVDTKKSMRVSALRNFGGDLHNLYESTRFDSGKESRRGKHNTKKDRKYFIKPWQVNPKVYA